MALMADKASDEASMYSYLTMDDGRERKSELVTDRHDAATHHRTDRVSE